MSGRKGTKTKGSEGNRVPASTKKPKPGSIVQKRAASFPVVGIGASAGGLAAFEAFLSAMPDDSDPGMAFVLVQHLAPDHKSILSELVRRYTRRQVFEVEDGMTVQPNCAYIIPPNRDMAFLNGTLQLLEPTAPRGQRLPIAFFFRSLAQDQHEKAIGIVLSGTTIDLVWPPGSGLWPVKLDPQQVDQILTELCTNARDAIGGVGNISVGTANVAVAETVLLVEDEKSLPVTTHLFLKDLGYTALVAEKPEQAPALVAEHPGEIHLLITDVIMQGMSGRDLAHRLLELRPAIKRLFISGFTADVIAQQGILDDGVNFLSKPFGRDAMAHKVREVLNT